ncbi:Neurobeachin-like protein 1 [Hypsibius exemplaris]|uniref:Neurobeachin-like protein 1 n=1 Tax=Hypsibius exemplaris TaxID=2072580 RepID=A0A1W0WSM6_HYPEX|nr:Neurobeachin-like protein 1 [Hypsibius exemplaris]
MVTKEDLQHYWVLYSMQAETKYMEKCIELFLELHRKYLLESGEEGTKVSVDGHSRRLEDVDRIGGPHLSSMPDGFLQAIARFLRKYADTFVNKPNCTAEDVHGATNLVRSLIIISQNVDNLAQLGNSTCIGDCLSIATTAFLQEDFATKQPHLTIETRNYCDTTLKLVECLYDPYSLWKKLVRRKTLNTENAFVSPPPVHPNVHSLVSKCLGNATRTDGRSNLILHALNALGAVLVGSKQNGVDITTDLMVDVLFSLLRAKSRGVQSDSRAETDETVLQCIGVMMHSLHDSSPDQRCMDVTALFSLFLQTLRSLPVHDEESVSTKLRMLASIHDILTYYDRAALQVIFIGVGIFEQLIQIVQQGADVVDMKGGMLQAVSSVKVLSAILRGSGQSKDLFVERIGYRMLYDVLTTITEPNTEFVEALIELVVESPEKDLSYLVVANPAAAVTVLDYASVLKAPELQLLIISRITDLLGKRMHSRIQCASYGMLNSILRLFRSSPQLRPDVADSLVRLFEILATHSINPSELKELFQLLSKDEEGFQPGYATKLLHSISSIANNTSNKNPFRYFDIQGDHDGIVVPSMRKKWPGPGFSFHAWVSLDDHPVTTTVSADSYFIRRILYSVTNNQGNGFEAFFTYDCVLVVAVSNKKEYIALSLTDHFLRDCKWHCIGIVHAPPKRLIGSSTLSIYVDGRLVHSTNMKLPNMGDPFAFFRIGSAPIKTAKPTDSLSHIGSSHPYRVPSSPMSPRLPAHELITIQQGSQDHIFGTPVSLKGQLNSICVFHDAILPSEAKELFDGGPNIVFRSDADAGELASKLFLYYNSNGCQGRHCSDLSPQRQNDGNFSGVLSTAWTLANSLSCIGGLTCLLPILEQSNAPIRESLYRLEVLRGDTEEKRILHQQAGKPVETQDSDSGSATDWVVIERTSSDSYIEQNPVAAFIGLLRKILTRNPELQEDIVQLKTMAITGYLLTKVESRFLDVNVLLSVQLLIEAAQGSHVWMDFLTDVYQYLLFELKIWVRADFTVRLGHLQYIRKLVKDDRKLFRKRFGVQLFLDSLRTYCTKNSPLAATLSEDEGGILRKHTLGVIQEFIFQNVNHYEVSALIAFVLTVKCERTVDDVLQLILTVLENPSKSDQIYLLLFEPHVADSLFCMLLKRQVPQETKAKIMSILGHLLRSAKVYDKSKSRMRLLDVGLAGPLMLMPNELPPDFAKTYFEQYFSSSLEHPGKFGCIIALFNKLHHAALPVKMEYVRRFLYAIYMKQGATAQIALVPGWYHSLAGLLIESPMVIISGAGDKQGGKQLRDLIDLRSPEEETVTLEELALMDEPLSPFQQLNGQEDRRSAKSESDSAVESGRDALESMSVEAPSPGGRRDLATRSETTFENSPPPTVQRGIRTVSQSALHDALEDDILNRESFTFLDDSLTKASRPETAAEDLCGLVLNILSTVLWQGIDGSSAPAWGKRAEVIASLDMVALSNYLYRRPEELKRRLYEMAIQVVISDVKKDPLKVANVENSELVVRLVHDFITAPDLHTNLETKLTDKLLEDFSSLLDAMQVWDSGTPDGWSETLQMGMDVWLTVCRCPDLKYCSIIIPKLHYAIQSRLHCNKREVCYVLSALNDTLMMAIEMSNQEHISFVVPVLRLMLEKWAPTLSSTRYLPNVPALNLTPQTWPTLQKYFRSPEWGNFIGNHVTPLATDYQNLVCKIRKERMNEFWNEAHDAAMAQLHARNKAFGESKLRFTQEYIEPARKRMQEENYRFNCHLQDAKSETAKTLRKWEEMKRYLFRERGPWRDKSLTSEVPLKMSPHENYVRMRLKLTENLHFDLHTEAAQLRDNTSPQQPAAEEPPHIVVAKEAKVDHVTEDILIEDDVEPSATTGRPPSNEKPELEQREKLIVQENCDLVTITDIVQGRFELTTHKIKFYAMNPAFDATTGESYDFEIPLPMLREIHLRRYNLRRSALEFFLIDQTNYFLNFTIKSRNDIYKKVIALKPPALVYLRHTNPAFLFKASGLTQKWVQREISNFEYLMALNTIAGRTYNDLSQYPVFPWILRDYNSSELDFEEPTTFRDLSRPMGVQNPKGINEVRHKFENFEDPTGSIEPFHYGQHYSNPASVIHYLIRVEPFTTLHVQLQSGRFDVADRQFHSITSTWDLLWNNPNDVKELIPEFFFLPEFLVNLNKFDFGCLQQTGASVNDVILPKWAKTPEEFIYWHRKALESDYVSAHLHDWIDLIFGFKQQGPAAEEALNIFYYCTYEGAVDLDAIADPMERQATEGMINNFGQTPCQLLKEPHPRRLTFDEATRKYANVEGRLLNVFHYTKFLKAFLVEANVEGDPLVYVTVPKVQSRNILQQTTKSDLITIGRSGALGLHIWTPYDRVSPKNMTFERDPTLANPRYTRSIAGPFHPSLNVNSTMFAITSDCKLLFYGGNWDNSLRVYNFSKGKTIAQVIRHRDLVTCVALDGTGLFMVTGSRDTTCITWEILQQNGVSMGINGKPLLTLYGHDAEVTCVAMSVELDMVVSGSRDGTIVVHTARQGLYVRTLTPSRKIPPSPRNLVNHVAVTYDGKIAAACHFPECRIAKYSVELYSLNGKHLYTEPVPSAINDLIVMDDFVVTGDAEGRLEIREWFQLRLIYSMQVSSPIISLRHSAVVQATSWPVCRTAQLIILTVAPNISDVIAAR